MLLWPQGEPAATPEWIRANVDELLAALEQAFGRMHWLLWLLDDLDGGPTLDG